MVKRILALVGLALLALAAVLLVRTLGLEPEPSPAAPVEPVAVEADSVAAHLSTAIRVATVSTADAPPDSSALATLHRVLELTYPRAHAALEREVVGGGSLLYTWPGTDSSARPILLLAHLDVVPVPPGSAVRWSEPPFEGRIADGFVWGRGAMDDKGSVVAILEAVEALLAEGHRPERTVLLAFGHDEERGGSGGAERIAELLDERDVRPAIVLDEGYAVLEGLVPGVERPVAVVGVAEKGYLSVELVARAEGGHSSMPSGETAVGILARAIGRLEERRPAAAVDGPVRAFLERIAPAAALPQRIVFANLWLTAPLVARALARSPSTNALVRTTTAPTMLSGSDKDNVLPAEANGVVNFRIHPHDTPDAILDHVRETIDDERIEVRTLGAFRTSPSEVSPDEGPAWDVLAGAIRGVFPTAVVAPSLVVGGTDARHYAPVAEAIYRFLPMPLAEADLGRIHGVDERIAVDDLVRMVDFYAAFVRHAGAAEWSE